MNKRTSKKRTVTKKTEIRSETVKKAEEELRIGELDQYLFGQGTHYDIYKKLGAHKTKRNGKSGVYFAVWAPNAAAVNLIGEFNDWD